MQRLVGVKYSPRGKVYYFFANGLNLKKGDHVIVETAAGPQYGFVDFEEKDVEPREDVEIKSVIRVATEKDEARKEELTNKTIQIKKEIKLKVAQFKLAMKISEVNFTFDAAKLIIEFTADDRVDFRELLKDLAATYKVRIELRQIGQRDEVKNKGGLGPCGQICCCKRFLNDFEHVSVKMAKNQGISLSPTKINGLCGRLMCCLAYENKTYEEVLKRMPKVGSEVETENVRGVCVYCDVLRELVSIKSIQKDGSFSVEEFPLAEIKTKKENKNGF